jgi:hypothetical protein
MTLPVQSDAEHPTILHFQCAAIALTGLQVVGSIQEVTVEVMVGVGAIDVGVSVGEPLKVPPPKLSSRVLLAVR